jgi:hypothetical protein
MPKHFDPEETIDSVIFGIVKLQKEGWALSGLDLQIEYESPEKGKKRRLPVAATMTVRLRPI